MRNFAPLLYFNLKTIPPAIWLFCMITIVMAVFFNDTTGEHSGFETALTGHMGTMYSLLLGVFFFSEGKTGGARSSLTPIPHGEFLFARPVSRRSAWLARACLYFTAVFAAPVIFLCVALFHPDFKLSLYQEATRHTEAAGKLALYQAAFPDSAVVHEHGSSHDTLVIPRGWLFLAGWQLLVTILLALGLQILTFLSSKTQLKIFIFYIGTILIVILGSWKAMDYIEPIFFQFSRHWRLVALGALAVICLVQWFACKRAGEMEVI
jgi:hypothetical protein